MNWHCFFSKSISFDYFLFKGLVISKKYPPSLFITNSVPISVLLIQLCTSSKSHLNLILICDPIQSDRDLHLQHQHFFAHFISIVWFTTIEVSKQALPSKNNLYSSLYFTTKSLRFYQQKAWERVIVNGQKLTFLLVYTLQYC